MNTSFFFLLCTAVFITLVILVLLFYIKVWSQVGRKPRGKAFKRLKKSKQFNKKKNRFVNPKQLQIDKYVKEIKLTKVLKEFFRKNNHRVPKKPLPTQKINTEEFLKDNSGANIVWFGHSSFMLRFRGKTLLFDPVFTSSLTWPNFLTPRFQPPAAQLPEIPLPDYVVLTHDHYDHLNWQAITYLLKNSAATFVMPLGVSSHLKHWGVPKNRIIEADWGDRVSLNAITLHCTPARHFSGRIFMSQNKTLWCSWVIEANNSEANTKKILKTAKKALSVQKIFCSGDSGYDDHFKEIAKNHGPFCFAIMENGQYHDMWRPVHMHPEEMVKALEDIKCKHALPIHWGMFSLAPHNWNEPMLLASDAATKKKITLYTPQFGQTLKIVKSVSVKKTPSATNVTYANLLEKFKKTAPQDTPWWKN